MVGFAEVHHRWVCTNSSRWQEKVTFRHGVERGQPPNIKSKIFFCYCKPVWMLTFLLLSQFYLIFIHVYNVLGSNFPCPLFLPSNPFLSCLYVDFHSVVFLCVFSTSKLRPNFQVKFPSFCLWVSFSQPSDMGHLHSWEGMSPKATIICQSHVAACQVVRHAQPCLMSLGGK